MRALFNPFRIDWNTAPRARWDALYARCRRPSLLQSSAYALALAATEGMRADLGVIHFDDKPIGLVQVQVKPLLKLFSVCRLHRGPAWIHERIPGEMQKLVLAMLRRRYRLRHGRGFVFHPELTDSPEHRQQLSESGFRRRFPGYRTLWLDLRGNLDTLRRRMKTNWRNALVQAERADLICNALDGGPAFDWLIEAYTEDKLTKGYLGPGDAFLRRLKAEAKGCNDLWLLRAAESGRREKPEATAGVIIARHGQAATYIAGWNGPRGRKLRAHHLLLWEAVRRLKTGGVDWFDLGGINPEEAEGVTAFKQGLGGLEQMLVGGYV